MKHEWQHYDNPAKTNAEKFMGEPERRCAHCGTVQQRITQHAWMRVTGYLWRPLAGRCRPPA